MNLALLAFVTGKSPAHVRAHADDPLPQDVAAKYQELKARLDQGEPLAYIVGSAGFYRREFLVDPRVLIPRPETEHLVEAAIAHLRAYNAPRALDVGTGSGAIALTLAAEVPQTRIDATDASPEALIVAITNRDRLDLQKRVAFYLGDLLEPVVRNRYDAIVANLPYVPTGEGDPDLRFEPALALDGGPDGLAYYRRFFARVPRLVNAGGLVLAEGAPPIAEGLLALAQAAFPGATVTLERDYGGRERYVKVMTPG
ncbi:MAG: peptide chain release factor N(5)-glutamine methyltransferase [Candidatus Aquilonibacter sp.]